MLLLRLRVDSFSLADLTRTVDVNRFSCSTMATRRRKKRLFFRGARGKRSSLLFRHFVFLGVCARNIYGLRLGKTEQSRSEGERRHLPPKMRAKSFCHSKFLPLSLFSSVEMMASCSGEKESRVLDKSDEESELDADNEVKRIMSKWTKAKSATEEPVAKKLKKMDSSAPELSEDVAG